MQKYTNDISVAGNVSIRQLTAADWSLCRQIRLEALTLEASKFGPKLETEKNYSDDFWRHWLGANDRAVFGLFDGTKMIGMTGVLTWTPAILEIQVGKEWGKRVGDQTAMCASSYIQSHYRGKGHAYLFHLAATHWAGSQPKFSRLLAPYRASNKIARGLRLSRGFQEIDRHPFDWPDGVREDVVISMLDLKIWRQTITLNSQTLNAINK